jgi:hypothetical protein
VCCPVVCIVDLWWSFLRRRLGIGANAHEFLDLGAEEIAPSIGFGRCFGGDCL